LIFSILKGLAMQISPFTPDDIHPFLALAKDEGWISTRHELAFLLERSPDGCLVCREEGKSVGFVTAVRYGLSGWIGNLLVAAGVRGKGIGTALFRQAMQILQSSGVRTVWLTASTYGRPIYERNGFRLCDQIIRWERSGEKQAASAAPVPIQPGWQQIDYLGWGDVRNELLDHAVTNGTAAGTEQGFLVLQYLGSSQQIGPFGALSSSTAEQLLEAALPEIGRVLLDVPASNRSAAKLLTSNGFTVRSEVDLMYAGQPPAYHPEHIFGLASMGSMG
jgi:ribosomal protein S18 acetylase RimI-like enzyme